MAEEGKLLIDCMDSEVGCEGRRLFRYNLHPSVAKRSYSTLVVLLRAPGPHGGREVLVCRQCLAFCQLIRWWVETTCFVFVLLSGQNRCPHFIELTESLSPFY